MPKACAGFNEANIDSALNSLSRSLQHAADKEHAYHQM
jgi:hypothetical protein